MSTTIMPETDALQLFLTFHPPQQGVQIFSGFVHALKEARLQTNRDQITGQKLQNAAGLHGSWLGAVGYFALLDQIGKCFKPQDHAKKSGNSIRQALGHFTALNDDEIDALYALRCAFAHDYSLYNVNRDNLGLMHNFVVGQGASTLVVSLPAVRWDGDLQNQVAEIKTTVNLEAFADLVEQVVLKIMVCHKNNNLEILLSGGSDELVRRYMFVS